MQQRQRERAGTGSITIPGLRRLGNLTRMPAESSALATRVAGVLLLIGAVLIAITVVLPPAARGSDLLILGLGGVAALAGGALLALRRVSEPVLGAAVALGTALITTATVVAGPGRGTEDNEVLLLWVLAYSFWFFRPAHALGQLALVGAADVVILNDQGPFDAAAVTRWLVTMSTFLVVGLLTLALRQRLERQREERARLAVIAERMRIARELHDATGHGINVMSIQAAAALNTFQTDPDTARTALEAIRRTSKNTSEDMRRLLGVLRERGPAPEGPSRSSLARLDELLEESRRVGVPVESLVRGEPVPLPLALDQAAYRIVQEALTNVRKHAGPGARAAVALSYERRFLDLEVVDDGRGVDRDLSPGEGKGLIGMRERVALFGGGFEAGPAPGGGFRVHARIKLRRSDALTT